MRCRVALGALARDAEHALACVVAEPLPVAGLGAGHLVGQAAEVLEGRVGHRAVLSPEEYPAARVGQAGSWLFFARVSKRDA